MLRFSTFFHLFSYLSPLFRSSFIIVCSSLQIPFISPFYYYALSHAQHAYSCMFTHIRHAYSCIADTLTHAQQTLTHAQHAGLLIHDMLTHAQS
jgi:hypothetical protein